MPHAQTHSAQDSARPRILLTFVGSHDPFRGEDRASGDGLFYNSDEFLKRASDVLRALKERRNETPVTYEHVHVIDPTDHAALYEHIEDCALKIAQEVGAKADLWIGINDNYCAVTRPRANPPFIQTALAHLVPFDGVGRAKVSKKCPSRKFCGPRF
jgi:hypothetical protein